MYEYGCINNLNNITLCRAKTIAFIYLPPQHYFPFQVITINNVVCIFPDLSLFSCRNM